jgi:serine protease Do
MKTREHAQGVTRRTVGSLCAVVMTAILLVPAIPQDGLAVSEKPLTTETFRRIAESTQGIVVNISSTQRPQRPSRGEMSPFEEFFWFHRFFEMPERMPQRQSLGSGFVLDTAGHVLTNNHVIENADEVKVKLYGSNKEYAAEVKGTDPKTDLALLFVKDLPENLPTAALGDSDELRPGDWVMAIGNPFGFEHTVTVGVVSAKGRYLEGNYDNYIQTDASINPGNSGGPLLNVDGEVVGINTAIFTRSGGNMGIGFAIPINMVKNIVSQLLEKGVVERGYLGVMIANVEADVAKKMGLPEASGALVSEVLNGTPAEKAGLEPGDVIVGYDGKPIEQSRDLPILVAETLVGTKVALDVYRGGKKIALNVTIGRLEEDRPVTSRRGGTGGLLLGMRVAELDDESREQYGLDRKATGVVVVQVAPGSPAHAADIQPGDLILKVNRRPVKGVQEVEEILRKAGEGELVLFHLRRESRNIFRTVRVP